MTQSRMGQARPVPLCRHHTRLESLPELLLSPAGPWEMSSPVPGGARINESYSSISISLFRHCRSVVPGSPRRGGGWGQELAASQRTSALGSQAPGAHTAMPQGGGLGPGSAQVLRRVQLDWKAAAGGAPPWGQLPVTLSSGGTAFIGSPFPNNTLRALWGLAVAKGR